MINRRITILGPEGTNIYVISQYLIFCVISWFTLFNITNEIGLDIQNVLVRQITFTLIGLIVFFLFTYVSISNIFGLSYVLMVSSTILLIGVLFTEESLGARRRYDLGVFDFQPSEFTKIAFVIFLASIISQRRNNLFAIALIFSNILLIYSQPDLGTTIILLSVVLGMYFISDVKMKTFIGNLLNVDVEEAHRIQKQYFRTHGTTLRGLMDNHGLEPGEFLDYVHDIDVTPVPPNPALNDVLYQIDGRKLKKLIDFFKSIPFLRNSTKTYLTKLHYFFEPR